MIKKLANFIIRPERYLYEEDELGDSKFNLDDDFYERRDFTLKNKRGYNFPCTMYCPYQAGETMKGHCSSSYSCIIYCHGNSGNRTAVFEVLEFLLLMNYVVVCFDFSGCGLSEGDYVSMGFFEKDDLKEVVNYVEKLNFIDGIFIWGKSMGAATTLMLAGEEDKIMGICLDSAFADLNELFYDVSQKYFSSFFGKIIGDLVHKQVREEILERAGFDIRKCTPIEAVKHSKVPAFFVHGIEDNIVPYEHSINLVENYKGNCELKLVEGSHNDMRDAITYECIVEFFQNLQSKKARLNIPNGTKRLTKTLKNPTDDLNLILKTESSYKMGRGGSTESISRFPGVDDERGSPTHKSTYSPNNIDNFVRRKNRHVQSFIEVELLSAAKIPKDSKDPKPVQEEITSTTSIMQLQLIPKQNTEHDIQSINEKNQEEEDDNASILDDVLKKTGMIKESARKSKSRYFTYAFNIQK